MRTRLRHMWIDGRSFVWRAEIRCVPGSADCHRCVRVRVWGAGKNGRALQADLLSMAWPARWGACATDGAYPTVSDLRAVVGYAIAHGWDPMLTGGTFALAESDDFALPGFLLTDRLRTPEGADPTVRVVRAHEARRRAGAG